MINDTDNNMGSGGGDGVQQRVQPSILSPNNNNATTSITVVNSPRTGDYTTSSSSSKKSDPSGPLSPSSSSPPPPQWQAADWMLILTMLLLVVGTVQVVAMGGFFSGGGQGDLVSFSQERIAKLESRASLLSDSVRNTTMDIGAIFEELRALENVPAYRAALDEARADANSHDGDTNALKTPKGKRVVEELNRLHQAAIKEAGRIQAMVERAKKSYMDYYHEKEEV